MSDINRDILAIPGGEKLLRNVKNTGELLVESGATVEAAKDVITKELLIELVQRHAVIGEVMVEAIERVRKAMNDEVR